MLTLAVGCALLMWGMDSEPQAGAVLGMGYTRSQFVQHQAHRSTAWKAAPA
jgi:hypothetical protein